MEDVLYSIAACGDVQDWLAVERIVNEFDEVIEQRHPSIADGSSSSSMDLTSEPSVKTEL